MISRLLPARLLSVMLMVLAVAGGCGGSGNGGSDLSDASALEYRFNDSSVAPEYHRSFTLTLAAASPGGPASGTFVVDSYGEVLHDVEVEVDSASWSSVLSDLAALDRSDIRAEDGCAGGTSRAVAVRADDGTALLDRTVEVCGGGGREAATQLAETMTPLLAGLDLTTLLAT
jgi:hypothetical protein